MCIILGQYPKKSAKIDFPKIARIWLIFYTQGFSDMWDTNPKEFLNFDLKRTPFERGIERPSATGNHSELDAESRVP